MARTRKQWLETFIGLADRGAPAIEYRKRLRIKNAALQKLIKRLTEFRHELKALEEEENVSKNRGSGVEEKEEESQEKVEQVSTTKCDEEALGARVDSGDESDVHSERAIYYGGPTFKRTVSQDEDGDDAAG